MHGSQLRFWAQYVCVNLMCVDMLNVTDRSTIFILSTAPAAPLVNVECMTYRFKVNRQSRIRKNINI